MTERPTLAEWADEIARKHEDYFAREPKGELIPCFALERASGRIDLIPAPWRDEDDKAFALAAVSAMLTDRRFVRYAFWSEAWTLPTAVSEDSEDMKTARAKKLHQHPDRIEMVMTACVDRDPRVAPVQIVQRIWRGRAGGVRRLERVSPFPNAPPGEVHAEGAMMDLFGQPTTH